MRKQPSDKCTFCGGVRSISSLAILNNTFICEDCYLYSDLKKPEPGEIWESPTDGIIVITKDGASKRIKFTERIDRELNKKNLPKKLIFTFAVFKNYKLNRELTKKYKELLDIKYIIE
jgi:hypothetical protein